MSDDGQKKDPPCSLHKSRSPRAFLDNKEEGKKIERNEETIGDILAAEATPGVENTARDSRSGKSREINFPVTSHLS